MKPGYEQYKQATKQLKSGFLKLGLELATLKLSGSATKDGGGNRKMRVRSRSKQVLVTGRSSLAGGWTAAGPPCCELCEWRTHGMPSASPPESVSRTRVSNLHRRTELKACGCGSLIL